ncbi:MAG: DUF166 family protein [Methanomicrobiales archaeon]
MRIVILTSGKYGSRIVNNIASRGLAPFIVGLYEFDEDLPELIDDFDEFIPENLPECDLIISIGLFGDINMVIPMISSITNCKSIIIPIYHPKQIPAGLQQEIIDSLNNATVVFPKPFCSLTEVGDKYVDKFAKLFGKPELMIEFNKRIGKIKVLRGAPCGSTWFIAEKLEGIPLDEAEFVTGDKFHNYPCLASMDTDPAIGDTIMHLAGYKSKEAVKNGLGFAFNTAKIDPEVCQGGENCDYPCIDVCPTVKIGDKTIYKKDDEKAEIDPATCGCCELCVKECPFGAVEIISEKVDLKKFEKNNNQKKTNW